jgi:oligoribonuclease NrnB/cAMP/cGMP phosphodiesterase (DHH superfamily)
MMPLVIYHANCWDGFCAAWVARIVLGEIEAQPAHYGSTAPIVNGRDVYVLDFSYPRAELERMHAEANSLLVIDHHATAREALAGLPCCLFDMERSGGRLTWDYFTGGVEPRPWLVDYTEDRDLWRHALPDSEEINAALRSHPLDFTLWDSFDHEFIRERFATEGAAIRRAERQIVQQHVRNAKRQDVGGHVVPVVNATVMFSEIAGELAKGEPFAACYFDRQDGKRQWSLRSAPDGLDVSVIAKANGGGGHRHAAGFETAA